MVDKARAAGLVPVLTTTLPIQISGLTSSGSTSTGDLTPVPRGRVERHNAWVTAYARAEGIGLLDTHAAVVDPTTGEWVPEYVDQHGLHPTAAGITAICDYLTARSLPPAFVGTVPLPTSQTDGLSLLKGGTMTTPADVNNYPQHWSVTGAGLAFPAADGGLIAPDPGSGVIGNWTRIRATGSGEAKMYQQIEKTADPSRGSVGYGAGDRLAMVGRIRSTDDLKIALYFNGGGMEGQALRGAGGGFDGTFNGEGVFYAEAIVPAGAPDVLFEALIISGTGNMDLAQVGVLNLTRLGMA